MAKFIFVVVESLSCVGLFAIPWTVAWRVPLSMWFPRQEYWSGLPFPSSGELPDLGIEPMSPALAGGFFTTETPEFKKMSFNKVPEWFLIEHEKAYGATEKANGREVSARFCPIWCHLNETQLECSEEPWYCERSVKNGLNISQCIRISQEVGINDGQQHS